MTTNISACIITHDEEQYIERSVTNIRDYVDEVIIIDSGSTDNTVAICESLGCKVFYRKFEADFAAQRNYAVSMCSNNHIVMLDADEYFNEKTLTNLQFLFKEAIKNNIGAYKINCHSYLDEKFLNIVEATRLLRKDTGSWQNRVHETFTLQEGYTYSVLPADYILEHRKTLKKQLYNNLLYLNIDQGIYERPSYDKGMFEDAYGKPVFIENQRNDPAPFENSLKEYGSIHKDVIINIEKYYQNTTPNHLKDYVIKNQTIAVKLESIANKLEMLKKRK